MIILQKTTSLAQPMPLLLVVFSAMALMVVPISLTSSMFMLLLVAATFTEVQTL